MHFYAQTESSINNNTISEQEIIYVIKSLDANKVVWGDLLNHKVFQSTVYKRTNHKLGVFFLQYGNEQ